MCKWSSMSRGRDDPGWGGRLTVSNECGRQAACPAPKKARAGSGTLASVGGACLSGHLKSGQVWTRQKPASFGAGTGVI